LTVVYKIVYILLEYFIVLTHSVAALTPDE
jgi:hypothetical protein